MFDDNFPTSTSKAQNELEKKILVSLQELEGLTQNELEDHLVLQREFHVTFLQQGLGKLSAGFASLDASRPWICYWIIHSLALLDAPLPDNIKSSDIVQFLKACEHPEGGYGGGPMQLAHLAPTYAAVCSLVTLGGDEALSSINRAKVYGFLQRMCVPPLSGGGFSVHDGGEADLRACFCAMAVAHLLRLDKHKLAEQCNMAGYVQRCQTYEGGLGGEPGNEAHGGYTFCGVAALYLVGQAHTLDLPRLVHWAVHRQGWAEGGFNGRTNKLVDGCYSFWQGGLFPLLQRLAPDIQAQMPVPRMPPPADVSAPAPSITVPPLPLPNLNVRTLVEQAELDYTGKSQAASLARMRAVAASNQAEAALTGQSARKTQHLTMAARPLMEEAVKTNEAAEQAATNWSSALASPVQLAFTDPAQEVNGPMILPGQPPMPYPLYNYKALQVWILRCCQSSKGGLRDKPGKPPDYYHTCYCLSGLAAAQQSSHCVLGPQANQLRPIDPAVNVLEDRLKGALKYWDSNPLAAS